LLAWIESYEFDFETINLTEKVYLVVAEFDPICENGNKRSFKSWSDGYVLGCGRPKQCECVFKAVNEAHHRKIDKLKNDLEYRTGIGKKITKKLNAFYERTSDEDLRIRYDSIKASLQSQAVKDKRAKTKIERGQQIDPAERTERDEYYHQVGIITEQNFRDHFYEINPEGLSRGEYHLDHIYSKIAGYRNGISPEVIGHWKNLRMMTELDNKIKAGRCDQTIEELMEAIK